MQGRLYTAELSSLHLTWWKALPRRNTPLFITRLLTSCTETQNGCLAKDEVWVVFNLPSQAAELWLNSHHLSVCWRLSSALQRCPWSWDTTSCHGFGCPLELPWEKECFLFSACTRSLPTLLDLRLLNPLGHQRDVWGDKAGQQEESCHILPSRAGSFSSEQEASAGWDGCEPRHRGLSEGLVILNPAWVRKGRGCWGGFINLQDRWE